MATNKFLTLLSGVQNFVTAISTSTGVADANKIIATDGTGKLDASILPTGVGAETKLVQATETLTAGTFVNIYNDAGNERVRLADSSNQRFANGFVLTAATTGNNATVYLTGVNNALSGLTTGSIYFLSTTGTIAVTAPDTNVSGNIVQVVGSAISATELSYTFDQYTLVA